MGGLSGLKRFINSAISAVLMYFVSQALFDWFNASMDSQIISAGNSISGMLHLLKTVANILAFDAVSLLLSIVTAVIVFIKTVDE